ncbi:hypothetical protein AgCh_036710 [Apium graveolens]
MLCRDPRRTNRTPDRKSRNMENARNITIRLLLVVMAARRLSSFLLSRSLSLSSASASPFLSQVAEKPIAPPAEINYTKLLINGQFVDSASGMFSFLD